MLSLTEKLVLFHNCCSSERSSNFIPKCWKLFYILIVLQLSWIMGSYLWMCLALAHQGYCGTVPNGPIKLDPLLHWWWTVFAEWLTNERGSALFPAGTIIRNSHHPKSPTNHKQDLNLHRTWVPDLLNKVVQ